MIMPEMLYENLIKWFLDNDYNPSNKLKPQMIKEISYKMNNNEYNPNRELELEKIKEINHEINNDYNPNSKLESQIIIDSKIITHQHAELISKWIDKLKITDKMKNLYEFKLILRGSRDGFTPEKFHGICDDHPNTIVVVKVKDSNEILGGYNPIVWKSAYAFGKTNDSFIFSFMNKNINDHIISRVKEVKYAINYCDQYGPSFGRHDLIILRDYEDEIFQIILKYIYGGKLSLNDYDVPDIINILVAARDLNLQELIPHLQTFLIKNETNWMEQNFNLIYQTSFKDDSFLDLQKFCTELISKQPEKIFKSPSFVSISEEALIAIIRSDNLQMNEVQIWEHVLKWGIAQNPELSSDSSSYSNGDFVALKNTLQLCIPHIKFIKFTSREFLNKVYPYKKIIPEELYESLIRVFLDNDYNPSSKIESQMKEINIDSKIITNQHVGLISKWIDKLEITNGIKNLYEFKLILRGSRDGFMPKTFHEMCDNISCTISIVKIKNSTEIVGGYNPIKWKNEGGFGITNNSFIFSFMNKENIEDHLLSRVNDERKAINFWTYCGPSFEKDLTKKRSGTQNTRRI
ncbi:carbohydrate-binding module family 13 protein [Rhizophagus clarus]|uniref:Carbohydrate-binding module family 13 protein n=1 Tax=Rhizophagus clarus TaxID=94130 RepID=A0A8H3QJV3_9GLOM|nr:carbohydrate-binding module family 13 protein [Rhizophagus clarus]